MTTQTTHGIFISNPYHKPPEGFPRFLFETTNKKEAEYLLNWAKMIDDRYSFFANNDFEHKRQKPQVLAKQRIKRLRRMPNVSFAPNAIHKRTTRFRLKSPC